METKHKIGNLCNMLYILYVIFLIYPTKSLIELGILSTNIRIFQIVESIQIGSGASYFAFQIAFLLFLTIATITESKIIIEYEDEEKLYKLGKKLIKYKVFVVFNIIGSLALIILAKDKNLLMPSVLLIGTSMAIHFAKSIYLKSYLFDRKRMWLEKITEEKFDEKDIDTRKWRRKIWFDNKVKVNIKDRKSNILINILCSLMFGVVFFKTGFTITKLIVGYYLIKNILELLENIFSLFTTINGVCTGIYEEHTRSSVFYKLVVTDYENKKEMNIKIDENYYIESMDRISIVHGAFSKQPVSLNNIKLKQRYGRHLAFAFVVLMMFGGFNDNVENETYKEASTEEYIDFDERQKLENDRELLSLDELGKYRKIDITKQESSENISVQLDKLYLGEKSSKVYFSVVNNTDKGMVVNIDYDTIVTSDEGKNSNILLPGVSYDFVMDILKPYDGNVGKELVIALEYTLSDTILNEYLDFSNYYHYPLNVVDKNCLAVVDLASGDVKLEFNNYDQFYNKQDVIARFQ